MEFAYYFFVFVVGLLFTTRRDLIGIPSVFSMLWFLFYFVLSLVVRTTYDFDMKNYAAAMEYSSLGLYYIKEPIVWLGQRYLFNVFENTYIVFVIFDILSGIILFSALRRLQTPQYVYFAILLFFPFVLGMQNVYRQWLASIIFLYAFSFLFSKKSQWKAYLAFLVAVLSHNVAAIFLPILFINHPNLRGRLLYFLALFVSFLGIYIGSSTKSSASTGQNLTAAYLALLLIFLFLYLVLDRGLIKSASMLGYNLLLGIIIITAFSSIILSSAGSERVAMFALTAFFPVLANKLEDRLKHRVLARACYLFFGFFPIFLFGTRQFIVG